MTNRQIKQRSLEYGQCSEEWFNEVSYIGESTAYDDAHSFYDGAMEEREHQWINPLYDLPENKDGKLEGYSIEVLGMFKDGSFCKCHCSIEENIWFIGMIVCDMPILWTYLPKE